MKDFKQISLSILASVLFFSCSIDGDDKMIGDQSLAGTWQLVEAFMDPGDGSGTYRPVENGFLYTFYKDGSFISNRFDDCSTGNYSVSENDLILDYDCAGFTLGIEEPAGTFVEEMTFIPGFLLLTPKFVRCTEGCGFKFKKIRAAE